MSETDQFDRQLRYVYVGIVFVNAALVEGAKVALMLLANSQERISKGKKYTEARNVIPLEVPDVLTPCTKL